MIRQKPGGGAGEWKGTTKKEAEKKPGEGVTRVTYTKGEAGIVGSEFVVEKVYPNPLQQKKELWRGIIRDKEQFGLSKPIREQFTPQEKERGISKSIPLSMGISKRIDRTPQIGRSIDLYKSPFEPPMKRRKKIKRKRR